MEAEGKRRGRSDRGTGDRAKGQDIANHVGHHRSGSDAGAAHSHSRHNARTAADGKDVAHCWLRDCRCHTARGGANGALQRESAVGERDRGRTERCAAGHLGQHGAAAARDAADGEGGAGVGGIQNESPCTGFCKGNSTHERERLGEGIAAGDFDRVRRRRENELVTGGEGAADGKNTTAQTDVGK